MSEISRLKNLFGRIWRRNAPSVSEEKGAAALNADAAMLDSSPGAISEQPALIELAPAERPLSEAVPEVPAASSGTTHYFADVTSPEIDHALIDVDAMKVISRLHQFGHQAYLVGGCVRDLLLGRTPKDFDIATSAHPGEVRSTFRNCRLIGRRFRLAHVYFKGGKIIEVSTFRANPTDLEEPSEPHDLGDNEEPGPDDSDPSEDLFITHDNVFGTSEQDARRRDFTINGLFYDLATGQVIDFVRGKRDLQLRQIRTIGDPEVRLREDPVRLLRAVRFSTKLDLDIEPRTYAAMEGAVEDLPRCPPPRLLEETFRLIRGGCSAPSLKLLEALDALKVLLPPIHSFLKDEGPDGLKRWLAYAAALDAKVSSSAQPIDDALLLAALLVPLAKAGPSPGGRDTVAGPIEDLLAELVRTSRLPRRIAERCRAILMAQRILTGERRRRGPLSAFREHPLFQDALTVFEISVEASGEFQGELAAWKSGKAPAIKPGAEGPSKRRRRRRGPRRPSTSSATPN